MTPDRWRVVDAILHAALACDPDRRDVVVDAACGADEALRIEVMSLLAAHVDVNDTFLERPVAPDYSAIRVAPRRPILPLIGSAVPHAVVNPPAWQIPIAVETASYPSASGRTVSARATLYVAAAMLLVGVVGGLALHRSSVIQRWTNGVSAAAKQAANTRAAAPRVAVADASLAVVNRAGALVRAIPANRPWTPRFSPDGLRVAYGAFGAGRESSDLWVTDLDAGTTRRLTDGDSDANDPQWSADGASIAYSARASDGKHVIVSPLGGGAMRVLGSRPDTQFPSDWLRDGRALLITEETGDSHDILVQPADGSAALPYAATAADETAARFSPDGRWVAYTSNASGRPEVYLDAYPRRGQRVLVSSGGGVHPVWRGDGRELYYWRDGALVAVQLGATTGSIPPIRVSQSVLFRANYLVGVNTMYDVSPDGQRFVIVEQP